MLEVTDDGERFDKAPKGHGIGFVNMTDRVGAVGRTLEVDWAPGKGTTLRGRVSIGS